MSNIFAFEDFVPVVDPTSFVHPNATVIGDVVIGKNVYIGPSAVLRGDWGAIRIGDGCNVQEGCVLHMFPGLAVTLEEAAHIGHGAIIHGAQICKNALVGMNAVVMDKAIVGAGSIIGALAFVPEEMVIPERKVAVGSPAKVIRDVSDEMLEWKTAGTALYQKLPQQCAASLRPVEPLRTEPKNRPVRQGNYLPWKSRP